MRSVTILALIIAFFVLTMFSLSAAEDFKSAAEDLKHARDVCEGVDERFISKHIHIPSFEVVSKRTAYHLCEAVIKAEGDYMTIYGSVDGDFIVLGEMFSSRVHISRESVVKYERKDLETNKEDLNKAVAFTYTPQGDVRDHLYFITDPQCPHCESVKVKMKEIADSRGLELRVVFFPINALSKDKATKGICSKMGYEDYIVSKYAGASCPEGQKKVDDAVKIGRKLKIGGVPTFITSKGLILEGFNAQGLSEL